MASKNQVLVLILLLSLLTMSSIFKPSHADEYCPSNIPGGKIAIYWGQNDASIEGTLTEACDSDLYNIVALAYLHVSGSSRSIVFGNHCSNEQCKALASQIQHCQSKGIQVLLSVEVDQIDDPKSLAEYLYNNFLSGQDGPLGAVTLNGTDLAHLDYSSEPWAELVEAIYGYSTQNSKIYISAAPLCDFTGFDSALATGHVDYLLVLYYGQYATCLHFGDGDFTKLLDSWKGWTSKEGVADHTSVFLGLVSSSDKSVASYGYISPEDLKSNVLPTVMESSNFGGVMLWDRYYDKQTGYSGKIKDALGSKVCECECHYAASKRFHSVLAESM
ncbi:acidic endochitinase-like [Prosopis cineraria]|uniref:acidic endochitinase-like n=1 Tax=Prosopis cineraria TaxID=364024 RepID=UPI00240F09E7|nr:acidic endochitinase-like [Prosopis cineraria]